MWELGSIHSSDPERAKRLFTSSHMPTHIHTMSHTHRYIHVNTYTYIDRYTHIYACIHTHTCIHTRIHSRIRAHTKRKQGFTHIMAVTTISNILNETPEELTMSCVLLHHRVPLCFICVAHFIPLIKRRDPNGYSSKRK